MDESTLLSIKQFSSFTGLSVSTLRYYDEMGILPPVSRGEDNNYRYYSPQQIIISNFIQVLVELGIPLSAIRELNENRSPEILIALLGQQEDRLDYLFNQLRTAYTIIHTYRRNILNGLIGEDGLIRVEDLSDVNYEPGPPNEFPDDDQSFYTAFLKFVRTADENKINLKYPVGGYHNDMESCLRAPGKPDRFISQDPFGSRIRPAGKYLVGYTRGYYGQFGNHVQKMADYAAENGLYFHGPVYTVYLIDEISVANPDEYLSRLSVRVSTRKNEPTWMREGKKNNSSTKSFLEQLRRS